MSHAGAAAEIADESLVRIQNGLAVTRVDNQNAFIDEQTGALYRVNEVGSRIIELVAEAATVGSIVDTLAREYDVDRSLLRRDVISFLQDLRHHHLVDVSASEV